LPVTIAAVASADVLSRLAEAAAHGDDVALAELVRATQPLVWRVCTNLGSKGEEEDLVQETYLRALRGLRSFRGEAPVRAWLAAIARNVCADHVRRRDRQARLLERVRLHAASEHHEDSVGSIADSLGVLDADRRDAFVLTQLVGLSYGEASVALDCPVGTIRSRVARARSQLMDAVAQTQAR
jgi:RNA polymerase sigma-70 factor (ECF subfamily)